MIYLRTVCFSLLHDTNKTVWEKDFNDQMAIHERDFQEIKFIIEKKLETLIDSCEINGRNAFKTWLNEERWSQLSHFFIRNKGIIKFLRDYINRHNIDSRRKNSIELYLYEEITKSLNGIGRNISNYFNNNFNRDDKCHKWMVVVLYDYGKIFDRYLNNDKIVIKQMDEHFKIIFSYGEKMHSKNCNIDSYIRCLSIDGYVIQIPRHNWRYISMDDKPEKNC